LKTRKGPWFRAHKGGQREPKGATAGGQHRNGEKTAETVIKEEPNLFEKSKRRNQRRLTVLRRE